MNTYEYKEAVETALSSKNFHEAFRLLRVMLMADNFKQRAEIEAAEEDYSRIMEYALSGAPDPTREFQLSALKTKIYSILDLLLREALVAEHNSLYFSIARTLKLRRNESLETLMSEYAATSRKLCSLTDAGDGCRRQAEDLEERIFERVWTTVPLSFDEMNAIRGFMADAAVSDVAKSAVIGALTMSLLQFFSESTLRLLLEFARPESAVEIRARATVGAVFVMNRWPERSNAIAVNNQIQSLRDVSTWQSDVERAIMQIIRSADVEKFTKTLQDEIIPEVMKLRPDIERHIKQGMFDPSEMEMNPEWEEMMEKTGLNEKLRKLTEMQEEGGDLFYSVFRMLKNFPFFNHIAHWFMPFSTSRRDVRTSLGHDAALELLLEESPAMCSSDKYSFALSVNYLPDAQKQILMSQLTNAAAGGMLELSGALTENDRMKLAITAYVHDLYRFFTLFRRSGEFVNPFKTPINPATIPALAHDFKSPDKVRLIGEYYFKHQHFEQALALFRMITPPDLALHQKMGHALQRLGQLNDALREYERAELLAPNSEWTVKRIARLHKLLGNYKQAIDYFERLEKISPDLPSIALNLGQCYLELNDFREALHYFYKAELLDESSTKPLRYIAWCAFLNKDYDTAKNYFDRILAELTPEPTDYLNMGHLALARNNIREAVNFYCLSTADPKQLEKFIADDLPMLEKADIDVSLLPLIIDAIRYRNDNK